MAARVCGWTMTPSHSTRWRTALSLSMVRIMSSRDGIWSGQTRKLPCRSGQVRRPSVVFGSSASNSDGLPRCVWRHSTPALVCDSISPSPFNSCLCCLLHLLRSLPASCRRLPSVRKVAPNPIVTLPPCLPTGGKPTMRVPSSSCSHTLVVYA